MKGIDWIRTAMLIGQVVFWTAEFVGATDKQEGNTFSEWFKALPAWVKMLLCAIFGGIFTHLIEWRIRDAAEK